MVPDNIEERGKMCEVIFRDRRSDFAFDGKRIFSHKTKKQMKQCKVDGTKSKELWEIRWNNEVVLEKKN
jgi:hypothetical protein